MGRRPKINPIRTQIKSVSLDPVHYRKLVVWHSQNPNRSLTATVSQLLAETLDGKVSDEEVMEILVRSQVNAVALSLN